jgi:hypothetical protein
MDILLTDNDVNTCFLAGGASNPVNQINVLSCQPGFSAEYITNGTVDYYTDHGSLGFQTMYDTGSEDGRHWACVYDCSYAECDDAHHCTLGGPGEFTLVLHGTPLLLGLLFTTSISISEFVAGLFYITTLSNPLIPARL